MIVFIRTGTTGTFERLEGQERVSTNFFSCNVIRLFLYFARFEGVAVPGYVPLFPGRCIRVFTKRKECRNIVTKRLLHTNKVIY